MNLIDPAGTWATGIIGSGSAEGGVYFAGAGATGSAGGGVFWGGPNGVNTGGFASFGTFAGGPGYGPSYPNGDKGNAVIGAFAGFGGGAFVTNATSASDLAGAFNTYSFNLGVGPVKLSLQLAESNGTWILSVTYGPGIGLSGSGYQTNTCATK